ncbi:MAG: hypothetical protein ACFFDH_02785 [Promethearchaeota archaeon]
MSDNVRIDVNQTLKHRLIEKYGPTIGRKISEAIQECIVEGHTGTALSDCIRNRLQDIIKTGKIDNANIDEIFNLMRSWICVG